MQNMPHLGVGLGYRVPLHRDILVHADRIDFLEFIFDKYLCAPQEKAMSTDRMIVARAEALFASDLFIQCHPSEAAVAAAARNAVDTHGGES